MSLGTQCRVQAGEVRPGPGGKMLPSLSETSPSLKKNIAEMEKIEEKYTFFVRDIANMAPLIVMLITAWA